VPSKVCDRTWLGSRRLLVRLQKRSAPVGGMWQSWHAMPCAAYGLAAHSEYVVCDGGPAYVSVKSSAASSGSAWSSWHAAHSLLEPVTAECTARISGGASKVTSSSGPNASQGADCDRSMVVLAGNPSAPTTRFGRRMPSGETSTSAILWQKSQVTPWAA